MKDAIESRHEEFPGSGFNSEQDKTSLLEIENRILKEKLGLSAGSSYFADDMDPLILNKFLRHILFVEDIGPRKPIRSLFPYDITFPPIELMDETKLQEKLQLIENILMENGVLIELAPTLPATMTYKYILEEMMGELIPCVIPEGAAIHFNGCGGWCPDCFQKEYCEIKKEVWPEL